MPKPIAQRISIKKKKKKSYNYFPTKSFIINDEIRSQYCVTEDDDDGIQ